MTNQLPTHQHQPHRRTVDIRIPAIEKYAYCLCLHVKPTTIFIAVFKMIRALLFASMLLNIEFSNDQTFNDPNLASIDERHKSAALAICILTRIVTASVSAVAIYAVIAGRAALLMPLYAMLLVDFFFSLPAFYNRDLEHSSISDGLSDFRNYSNSSNQYTRYSLLLLSTISVIVKVYFLCVIWKCYRYLRLIELVSPLRLPDIYPHMHQSGSQYPIVRILASSNHSDPTSGNNVAPPPYESITSSMKPPNYEEAIKTSQVVISQDESGSNISQQQVSSTDPLSFNQRQNMSTQVLQHNQTHPNSTIVSMLQFNIGTQNGIEQTNTSVCEADGLDINTRHIPNATLVVSTNDELVASNAL